jgi:hypothetical protein
VVPGRPCLGDAAASIYVALSLTAPLVPGVNHPACLLVDHLLAEPVSGLRVYLMKMDLLGL